MAKCKHAYAVRITPDMVGINIVIQPESDDHCVCTHAVYMHVIRPGVSCIPAVCACLLCCNTVIYHTIA